MNRLRETQRTLDGAHASYGSEKPGMFRHVWQTSATMEEDDAKRGSTASERRKSLLQRDEKQAEAQVEKRGSTIGASRRMSGLTLGEMLIQKDSGAAKRRQSAMSGGRASTQPPVEAGKSLIEALEEVADEPTALPPVRGAPSPRKKVQTPEFTSERELLRYLDKTDRSPRPGWRPEDEECPYKEGHSLFRAGADGTGFVDKHAALWPDTLPPSMKKAFVASEQAKKGQDANVKPRWNRDPDYRPPTQCPVVTQHDENVLLGANLARLDDEIASRKAKTVEYYMHEPFNLPELKADAGTW